MKFINQDGPDQVSIVTQLTGQGVMLLDLAAAKQTTDECLRGKRFVPATDHLLFPDNTDFIAALLTSDCLPLVITADNDQGPLDLRAQVKRFLLDGAPPSFTLRLLPVSGAIDEVAVDRSVRGGDYRIGHTSFRHGLCIIEFDQCAIRVEIYLDPPWTQNLPPLDPPRHRQKLTRVALCD